jgi:hypothetical protein
LSRPTHTYIGKFSTFVALELREQREIKRVREIKRQRNLPTKSCWPEREKLDVSGLLLVSKGGRELLFFFYFSVCCWSERARGWDAGFGLRNREDFASYFLILNRVKWGRKRGSLLLLVETEKVQEKENKKRKRELEFLL